MKKKLEIGYIVHQKKKGVVTKATLLEVSLVKDHKTDIQKLKENGRYGCTSDPYWNKITKRHDCCGATRSYYHKKGCKALEL